MLPELTHDDFSAALDGVAADVLAQSPTTAPPVDALDLAHRLGLAVAWDEAQTGRGRTAHLSAAQAPRIKIRYCCARSATANDCNGQSLMKSVNGAHTKCSAASPSIRVRPRQRHAKP